MIINYEEQYNGTVEYSFSPFSKLTGTETERGRQTGRQIETHRQADTEKTDRGRQRQRDVVPLLPILIMSRTH